MRNALGTLAGINQRYCCIGALCACLCACLCSGHPRATDQVLAVVLKKAQQDKPAWLAFQQRISQLKLERTRLLQRAQDIMADYQPMRQQDKEAEYVQRMMHVGTSFVLLYTYLYVPATVIDDQSIVSNRTVKAAVKIVLISGFESFNVGLYKQVAVRLAKACPGTVLYVFSDRDITSNRDSVQAALDGE